MSKQLQSLFIKAPVSGFVINSLVVSGWPGFEVQAYPASGEKGKDLSLLRKAKLNENTQIYLLKGHFHQLVFHLHPGKMHPGFLYENGQYTKEGGSKKISINLNQTIQLKDVFELSGKSDNAEFAAWLMEGTPAVQFNIN